jgi:hypothetical protein
VTDNTAYSKDIRLLQGNPLWIKRKLSVINVNKDYNDLTCFFFTDI